MPRTGKAKVSLSIDQSLLDWIDTQVENFIFQSRSDAFERAILLMMNKAKSKSGFKSWVELFEDVGKP